MSNEAGRAVADAVQWINLLVVLAILALSLDAGRRWPRVRAYLVGPVTYSVHSIIFYIVALMNIVITPWTSLWSALLRLHGYTFILATMIVFYIVAVAPYWPEDEASDE